MPKFYITFGQTHAHYFPYDPKNGRSKEIHLDKDTVAVVNCQDNVFEAMKRASELFGKKYSMISSSMPNLELFPKGLVEL